MWRRSFFTFMWNISVETETDKKKNRNSGQAYYFTWNQFSMSGWSDWFIFTPRYILVNQNHLTKCIILKLIEYKRAEEVTFNLVDIFTLIGTPSILQSDNGCEFSNIKDMWLEL